MPRFVLSVPTLYLIAGAVAVYTAYQLFFADNRDDRPPGPSRSHESPRPSVPRRDERQHRENIDSSQRDRHAPLAVEALDYASLRARAKQEGDWRAQCYQQSQEAYECRASQRDRLAPPAVEALDYASLRARAKQEGDRMAQCYQQSQEAYKRSDHARAKALSEEGKRHAEKMEQLNAQASVTIFKENNQDRAAGEVDLHGLFVEEAIAHSEEAITAACRRGDSEVRLIVGQGNHSEGGVPRLKPAIQQTMQSHGHSVEEDPWNPGVLLVRWG